MGKGWGQRRFLIAALVAALVVVPAVLILTQQRAASATTILSILDGSASVARAAAAFTVAADGDIVNAGDRVQTADRSHAVVTFFDGSTLEIEPATTVQIEEASSAGGGAITIRIAQTIGRTWASVQKLTRADSKFELRSPTLVAAVRGTGFITDVLADGSTRLQTTDGTVQVTAQGETVLVGAGQSTSAPPNAPPSAPAPAPASNRLRFGVHSPAYLVVVDPFGRACGVALPGPTVARQIPGCLATEPGTDPQLIDVPDAPTGTYSLIVASIAPGGAFVASASGVDSAGSLTFNYTAAGSGQPGDKFASRIDVSEVRGGLTASGLGALGLIEKAPIKLAGSLAPRPTITGVPDPSLFRPLPGIGFAAGPNTTAAPLASATPTLPAAPTVSITPLPSVAVPTATPTAPTLPAAQIPTVAPTVIPTAPPTPTLAPTPSPTPQPTPTPLPPTLSGGSAAPGGTVPVLGTNWPVGAAIVIAWPDRSQVASADVQPDGRFATLVRVPANAIPGQTYRITASGGGLTAASDVGVTAAYSPTLTLRALATATPTAGSPISYSGSGWPPNTSYALSFDGQPQPLGGVLVTSASGTLGGGPNDVFVVPANTLRGTHTVSVTAGGYTASASVITQ